MKTPDEIKKEIDTCAEIALNQTDKKIKDRMLKEINFFKNVLLYLYTEPTVENVRNQLHWAELTISRIEENYSKWTPPNRDLKNLRSAYNSYMNLKQYEDQVKTLKFILDEKA